MTENDHISKALREWCSRGDRGETTDAEAFLAEHAEVADELRPHLEALIALDEFSVLELEDTPPEAVGDYRIIREIGRGGMGVVYEAEQVSMQRRVALKLLAPAFLNSPKATERLHREARAAGRLQHTNIVAIHGMGQHEKHAYFTMELVKGGPLSAMIRDLRSSGVKSSDAGRFARVAEMFAGVADALHVVNEAGVIHRDIKPANLLLDEAGVLKIADFGMARLEGSPSLTRSGDVLGTPVYMSPEQAEARRNDIDHRSDIYSLGASLYEVVTLRPPFKGDSFVAICARIARENPPPPRQVNPHVPKDLATIIAKAMDKERSRRYQTGDDLARDLVRFAEGRPVQARPLGPVARAWRKIKRHKAVSSLAATVLLMVGIASLYGMQAARQEERSRNFEYDRLIASGQDAIGDSMARVTGSEYDPHLAPGDSARDYFTRAIKLIPARQEAFWLRALVPGRSMEERRQDLDTATALGLPETTVRLLESCIETRKTGHSAPPSVESVARIKAVTPLDHYAKAYVLRDLRDWDQMLVHCNCVVEQAKPSVLRFLARRLRAHARTETRNFEGALTDWTAILESGDDRISVRLRIAKLWQQLEREKRADAIFRECLAIAQSRDTVTAWASLCESCYVRPAPFAWLVEASRAALKSHPDDVKVLFYRSLACGRLGEHKAALELAEAVLGRDPDHHRAYEVLAGALHDLGKPDEALTAIDRAVATKRDCAKSRALRASILSDDLDRHEDAVQEFDRAIQLDPYRAASYASKSVALHRLDRLEDAFNTLKQAIGLDGGVFAYWSRLTVLSWKLNRSEGAVDAADRALAIRPGDAQTHRFRARALNALERYADALVAANLAIKFDPEPASAHYLRGVALQCLGRFPEARTAFEVAIDRDRRHVLARVRLGRILINKGGLSSEALTLLREAVKIDDTCVIAWRSMGGALANLGQYENAISAFERAKDLGSSEASFFRNFGWALRRARRPAEAIAVLQEGAKNWPEDVGIWWFLGVCNADQGKHPEALRCYETGLELNAGHYETHNSRGVSLMALGDMQAALKSFDDGLRLRNDHALLHANRGAALRNLNRLKEALLAYRCACQLQPQSFDRWLIVGRAEFDLERYLKAYQTFEAASKIHPRQPLLHAWMGTAAARASKGNYEKALAHFRSAETLCGNDKRALLQVLVHVPEAMAKLDRLEEALQWQKRLIDLSPRTAMHHSFHGVLLSRLGHQKDALKAIERALQLAPGNRNDTLNKARVLNKLGQPEKARGIVDEFVQRNPDDKAAKRLLDSLERK